VTTIGREVIGWELIVANEIITGTLAADTWTKVLSAWGYFAVVYGVSTQDPGGSYRCYTAPVPWAIASGPLPEPRVTHRVIGYGDVWLHSPVATSYSLVPVFP
jgi:hypothetical protein